MQDVDFNKTNIMYHFVKIKSKLGNDSNGKTFWYFVPNSVEQVIEHFKTIFGKEISAGIRDKMAGYKHADTPWRLAIDATCSVKGFGWDCHGLPWLDEAISLENMVLQNRIRDFHKYGKIYLANGVTQFGYNEEQFEIVEEIDNETLEYPIEELYHLEDVRYFKWDNDFIGVKGVHWYAKVGKYDIVDKNGNQKWNTKDEAEEAARWFCQELMYKKYHHYE